MCPEQGTGRTELTDRAAEGGSVEDYAGRVLADRYRLPRPPADEYELVETRAFDTYSGQEVLVRQVLLPEVVCADGRAMLSGLVVGAAQEALCGYDPLPAQVLAGGDERESGWSGPDSVL